jgi:hypothetical protein
LHPDPRFDKTFALGRFGLRDDPPQRARRTLRFAGGDSIFPAVPLRPLRSPRLNERHCTSIPLFPPCSPGSQKSAPRCIGYSSAYGCWWRYTLWPTINMWCDWNLAISRSTTRRYRGFPALLRSRPFMRWPPLLVRGCCSASRALWLPGVGHGHGLARGSSWAA